MICPHCHKNEVSVHYTEIIDGKMVEYHLCEDCAREKGFALTPSDAMAELIGSLAAERHPEGDENPACPHCGLTLKDIRTGGRLGCGECYRAFAANLQPLLKALHRGTRHTGRVPASPGEDAPDSREGSNNPPPPAAKKEDLKEEIARLRGKIKKAVAAEDYEKAARLRDRLAALSGKQA